MNGLFEELCIVHSIQNDGTEIPTKHKSERCVFSGRRGSDLVGGRSTFWCRRLTGDLSWLVQFNLDGCKEIRHKTYTNRRIGRSFGGCVRDPQKSARTRF